MRRHLEELEQELRAKSELRDRLARILADLDQLDEPMTNDYIEAIERMTMIEKHYTPEALAKLDERAKAYGPEQMQKFQDEWAELIAAMTAEMKNGTDPEAPEPQRLAARWRELVGMFTGGDPEIKAGLSSLYEEEGAEAASRGMMDRRPDGLRRPRPPGRRRGQSESALLEWGHRQARVLQQLPVVLGGLPGTGPDDGLAGAVDLVGHRVAAIQVDPGNVAGKRSRHPVEGVVVVVQHDHPPGAAERRPRAGHSRALDGLAQASASAFFFQ